MTAIGAAADDSVWCQFTGKINIFQRLHSFGSVGVILDAASAELPDLTAVEESLDHGVLSAGDFQSAIRFRIQLPAAEQRQAAIATIRAATGWINDPADWHINLTRRSGFWIAEVGALHYSRRLTQLRRQPWSTNPVLAAVLVRIAKITGGQIVHDPFCGTGTVLIAARQVAESIILSGTDHDARTLRMAGANLDGSRVHADLTEADAVPFPHPDGTVDRVVSNLPFGKQVGSHLLNTRLYPMVIKELARTLRPDGRAVLLTEDKRLLVNAVAGTPGLKISRERPLRYNGATPTAYTITRTRGTRRPRPGNPRSQPRADGQE